MRAWEGKGISWINGTENYFRGAAFLKGLDDAAGDAYAAREFVMMRHGDYDELTDFENNIRDLIPFYKWMRTNIPFQLRNLIEQPGKVGAVLDLQRAFIDEDTQNKLPSWMKESLRIPLPSGVAKLLGSKDGGGMLSFQLPMHDLYMGSNEFASSFLPVVRQIVLENGLFKKNLFTGAPLEGTKMYKAAGWMQATGIARVLHAVGMGEEGEDGDIYFNDRQMNMASIVPIFSRFRNFIMEDPDRTQLRTGAFLSAVVGVRSEGFGPAEFNEGERDWYYNVLKPQVDSLRNLGYPLPAIDEVSTEVMNLVERDTSNE